MTTCSSVHRVFLTITVKESPLSLAHPTAVEASGHGLSGAARGGVLRTQAPKSRQAGTVEGKL